MKLARSIEGTENKLQQAPILGYPNDRELYSNASLTGIGAILTQKQQDIDRVIAYASKTLKK